MSSLEKNTAELIELENEVAFLADHIREYKKNNEYSEERRINLKRMLVRLGQKLKRLDKLREIVKNQGD